MKVLDSLEALQQHYGAPSEAAIKKVANEITPLYRQWIERARFCVLTSVGPEGTDGSPRGDDEAVVRVIDAHTLALPDWKGNNRTDSLLNIVNDGRVSLLMLFPGSNNVIRINGRAVICIDDELLTSFERQGKKPRSVILITVAEVYFQCARALMRSRLWADEEDLQGLPSPGTILSEMTNGQISADRYDSGWLSRSKDTMY